MSRPLLIENGTILTMGATPAVRPGWSVLIQDGRIARMAPRRVLQHVTARRIDATRKVVLPGFINAHTHLYSSFARGLTATRPARTFNEVLRNLWWRLDSALTVKDCYYSALVALLESIRHGTTTIIDHHASPQAVTGSLSAIARAAKETGLRVCLCYELSDRDGRRSAREGMDENVAFIRRCQTENDPCRRALFGLHASFTLSDRTLEAAAKLGHELQTGFHIHVAEAESDQVATRRSSGRRVVERLMQFGLLGRRSIAAHCIHLNRREMDLLAATETAAVHNPQSNLNNAVGMANLVELKRRQVLVGLGTDAMTTNMLEELRVAVWAQHQAQQNPSAGFAEAATALFAGNPAIARRVFDLDLGELREGGVADVVVVDYDPTTPVVSGNCYGHLVFGASQATVDTTIVGGRVLMQHRRLTLGLDEARINARARELAKDLWQRL